ncbi:MAG: histidine kinase [Burkholderiaceae bacterium]|jgi:signal transduction histidine kinase|nr:histidine kinase [Burkholderiaceae bacterium]
MAWLRHASRWLLALAVLAGLPAWAQDCTPRILSTQARASDTAATPAAAALLQGWEDVTLPDRWTRRWPGHSGAVWYRLQWQPTCAGQPVALALRSMVMAGEVYANDDLLWRDRHLSEPLSRSWNLPRYWLLPGSALRPGTNTLWIRVHGIAEQTPGLGEVRLGEPQALRQWFEDSWWNQRTLFAMNLVVSLVLALLFAFAWLQRPASKAFGWYALNAGCWALFLTNVLMTEAWPYSSTLAAARANLLVFELFTLSFCLFTWRFGGQRFARMERLLWAFTAMAMAATVLLPWHWIDGALPLGMVCFAIICATALQFPVHAWRTRQPLHAVYAACLLAFLAVGVHDMLLLHHAITGTAPLVPYTAPLTMIALSMVLGRQFVLNMRRVEHFNQELSDSVARACDELAGTLEREHALALSHSRLQERMQLAHDLHDSLGGALVRSIAMVEQAGSPMHNRQFLSMLKLLRDDLRQMIDSSTSLSVAVPASPLEWMAPLRHRFASLFDELDIQSEWRIPPQWQQPPGALQCLALTRVVEEALTNVIKHSRAQQVCIQLQWPDPQWLMLRITDDGVGFDVAAVQRAGMGVGTRSMQARMERLGGMLDMDSEPGLTMLAAWLPTDLAPRGPATVRDISAGAQVRVGAQPPERQAPSPQPEPVSAQSAPCPR